MRRADIQKLFTAPNLWQALVIKHMRTFNLPDRLLLAAKVILPSLLALGAAGAHAIQNSRLPGQAVRVSNDLSRQMVQSDDAQRFVGKGPRGRPVMDHDQARQSARSGENRSFEELYRSAQSRGRGEYLGVEPDISRNIYRFKFMRSGGNVVWVDVDGRTARVLSEVD
ncbi:MAG: hypothetical protein ACRC1J_12290 [Sandaracinobacteroides sp.]